MSECRKKRWVRLNREKHRESVRRYKARMRQARRLGKLLVMRWAA